MEKNKEIKAELEAKYGRIITIEVTLPCLVTFQDKDLEFRFKMPTAADQDRLMTELAKSKMKAFKNLCVGSVIEEDKVKLADSFEEYPGLPATIAEKLMKCLGFGDSFLKTE
jgi:hypothetical protein